MIFIISVYNSNGEHAGQIIARIKDGDKQLRDNFIKDYIPFVLKVISNTMTSNGELKSSDEYSIGLIAFNEAIDKFDSQKSVQTFNFFSFAEQIIKRRLIDYIRVSSRRSKEISIPYVNDNEKQIFEKYLNKPFLPASDRMELFQEIKNFGSELNAWGLKISDMSKYTPKHRDSREMCVGVAKKIAENREIFNIIKNNKYFPMKELSKIVDVSPRTIERNKKFIISVSIIYANDYEHLRLYLEGMNYRRDKNA